MRWQILLVGLMPAIVSCGGTPLRPAPAADCGRAEQGVTTRLAMIRKLLDSGHPYAALAHLDAAAVQGPAADLLRADIQRRIGQTSEARVLYQGLLSTCLAGAGHHGLGLLAGQEGRFQESLDHLRRARQALPADARVRSDLGYALLLAGELGAARLEFLTAQDLDPEDHKAVLNLMLLLYRQNDATGAEAVARRYQVSDEEQARLRAEAARQAAEQGDKR